MKKLSIELATISALVFTACGGGSGLGGDDDPTPDADVGPDIDAPPGVTKVSVPAGDMAGAHWTADHIYVLEGHVFITSGTHTIDPGVVVQGKNGSSLVITKDAMIDATGTATAPIVFTSALATPASGDWGGVVLLGKAPINVVGGTNNIEGFATSYGDRIAYGGADAAHNCGTLKYARIEYAGFALAVDNELNGLTLGGCGSASNIDYVQVHLGLDDGVEVFGGTVDLKHLIITQPDDDGLDWDRGWTGRAQFVIVQQKAGRGDKGIEADNNNNNNELTPRSAPEIWNMTLIGADGAASDPQGGIHLRRGTAGKINNTIVAYFTRFAVDVDGASSVGQYGTNLTINHTYFVKGTNATAEWPTNFDVNSSNVENDCTNGGATCFNEATELGSILTNHVGMDVMLTSPKDIAAPSWKPMAGSPVLTGCGTPPAGFDQTATFCGAVGNSDWTTGWTRFGS